MNGASKYNASPVTTSINRSYSGKTRSKSRLAAVSSPSPDRCSSASKGSRQVVADQVADHAAVIILRHLSVLELDLPGLAIRAAAFAAGEEFMAIHGHQHLRSPPRPRALLRRTRWLIADEHPPELVAVQLGVHEAHRVGAGRSWNRLSPAAARDAAIFFQAVQAGALGGEQRRRRWRRQPRWTRAVCGGSR